MARVALTGQPGVSLYTGAHMNPYSPPAAAGPYGPTASPYAASNSGAVSDVCIEMLRQTRPWVMFLAILAFIFSALALVGGLFIMVAGFSAPGLKFPAAIGAVYMGLALVYVYPGIKMWMYASAIGSLMATRSTSDLEAALAQQKGFWKFSGIATIVLIALYIVVFMVILVVGVATMGSLGKLG